MVFSTKWFLFGLFEVGPILFYHNDHFGFLGAGHTCILAKMCHLEILTIEPKQNLKILKLRVASIKIQFTHHRWQGVILNTK